MINGSWGDYTLLLNVNIFIPLITQTNKKAQTWTLCPLNGRHCFQLEAQITKLFTFVSHPQLNRTSFRQGQKRIWYCKALQPPCKTKFACRYVIGWRQSLICKQRHDSAGTEQPRLCIKKKEQPRWVNLVWQPASEWKEGITFLMANK